MHRLRASKMHFVYPMMEQAFDTSSSIEPHHISLSDTSTFWPFTEISIFLANNILSPVTVTTILTSLIFSPPCRQIPFSVNPWICPVDTEAVPARRHSKKSPSGERQRHCSQGLYSGVKWGSIGILGGQLAFRCLFQLLFGYHWKCSAELELNERWGQEPQPQKDIN